MTRWLTHIGKGLLTIGVLVILLVTVDPRTLLASLERAKWPWMIAACTLLPVNLVLEGWVWNRLLTPTVGSVSLRDLATAVLCGFTLGFWTPVQVGEYAGRALALPRGDRWTISLTVFAQRMVDMMVGVGFGLAGLSWALWTEVLPASLPWILAATVGAGTMLLLLAFIVTPSRTHTVAERLFSGRRAITDRTKVFDRLSWSQIRPVVGGTILRYVTFTGQMVCLGLAFNATASVGFLFLAVTLTFYVKYLLPSLTFLDLGIREGSAAFFFQVVGLGAATGVNAALVLFAVNLFLPAVLGVPFLSRLTLGQRTSDPIDARSEPSVVARS